MSFFKWLFGIARKERLWTEAPRMLPGDIQKMKASDVMMSQEFQHPEKKYNRYYSLAYRSNSEDNWVVQQCEVSLKEDTVRIVDWNTRGKIDRAIDDLINYEFDMGKVNRYPALEGATCQSTYKEIGLQNGLQFDKNGNPYRPTAESGVTQSVTLSGENFKAVFAKAAEEPGCETWTELQKAVNCKKTIPAAVKKSSDLEIFAASAESYLRNIQAIEIHMKDLNASRYTFDNLMNVLRNGPELCETKLGAYSPVQSYASTIMRATALQATVEIAAQYYRNAAENGSLFDAGTLKIVESLGEEIVLAAKAYGLSDKQAEDAKNIMMLGPEVKKTPLAVEVFFEKFHQTRAKPSQDKKL